MPKPRWEKYEEGVEEVLRGLGYETQLQEVVEGARAKKRIDVTARKVTSGIELMVVAECKYWNSKVDNDKLRSFCWTVSDVGATQGLFFTESGAQSGAYDVIQKTNVKIMQLERFRIESQAEIERIQAHNLQLRLERIEDALRTVSELELTNYIGLQDYLATQTPARLILCLQVQRESLSHARYNRWPVWVPSLSENGYSLRDWGEVHSFLEEHCEFYEAVHRHMLNPDPQVTHWKQLLSSRMKPLFWD